MGSILRALNDSSPISVLSGVRGHKKYLREEWASRGVEIGISQIKGCTPVPNNWCRGDGHEVGTGREKYLGRETHLAGMTLRCTTFEGGFSYTCQIVELSRIYSGISPETETHTADPACKSQCSTSRTSNVLEETSDDCLDVRPYNAHYLLQSIHFRCLCNPSLRLHQFAASA